MTDVKLPDGTTVTFPDDTPREEMVRVMQEHFGTPQPRDAAAGRQLAAPKPTPNPEPPGIGLDPRTIAQGATLGSADEIEAFVRSQFGGGAYAEELARIRGELRKFKENNPGQALAQEFGGAALSGGGLARFALGKAPTVGRMIVSGLGLGAASGGFSSFATGEGGVGNRLSRVPGGTAAGAFVGAAVPGVAHAVGAGVRGATRFVSRKGRGRTAEEAVAKNLRRDRLTVADLERSATEAARTPGLRKLTTPEEINDARAALDAGMSKADVARGAGVAVKTLEKRLAGIDAPPLGIVELAKLSREGAGANISGATQAAGLTPGPASALVNEQILTRQLSQQGRLSNLFDRTFGKANPKVIKDQFTDALRAESKTAYDAFYAQPDVLSTQLRDLLHPKLVSRIWPKARNIGRIKDGFDIGKKPSDVVSARTLDILQRTLNGQAKKAFRAGDGSLGDALATARKRLIKFMDANYAASGKFDGYGAIRGRFAAGKRSEEALALGQVMALRAGDKQREALALFDQMGPDEQALVRIGFKQKLLDEVINPSQTSNVAAKLARRPAMEIAEKLLDKKTFKSWRVAIKQEREVTSTLGEFRGSRTTPLKERMDDLHAPGKLVGDTLSGNVPGVIKRALDSVRRGVTEQNALDLVRITMETDPGRLAQILQSLRPVEQRMVRQQIRSFQRSVGVGVGAANVLGSNLGDRR